VIPSAGISRQQHLLQHLMITKMFK
jgi:hypothetical protein